MLLQASQKTRITRGAGQAGLGFMAPMNCPRFWTANHSICYHLIRCAQAGSKNSGKEAGYGGQQQQTRTVEAGHYGFG